MTKFIYKQNIYYTFSVKYSMQKISGSIMLALYVVIMIVATYFCGVAITHPKKYEHTINTVCAEFKISKPLFYALVNTESSFNPNAKSSAGAIGLTQVLPSTAEYICVKNNLDYSTFDLYNPHDNLYIGAMYLRYLLNKFDSTYTALAAYNAGETVVRTWLNDTRYSLDKISLITTPYTETNNYLEKIRDNEKIYINFYKIK